MTSIKLTVMALCFILSHTTVAQQTLSNTTRKAQDSCQSFAVAANEWCIEGVQKVDPTKWTIAGTDTSEARLSAAALAASDIEWAAESCRTSSESCINVCGDTSDGTTKVMADHLDYCKELHVRALAALEQVRGKTDALRAQAQTQADAMAAARARKPASTSRTTSFGARLGIPR